MKTRQLAPAPSFLRYPATVALLLAALPPAQAANRDFFGASGGNWATAANWNIALVLDGTDNLRFRGTNVTNNNDFVGQTFNNISFINNGTGGTGTSVNANSAFNLTGNDLTLSSTGAILNTTASTAVINDTITLNMAFSSNGNGLKITTNTNHNLKVIGVISGAGGTVTKDAAGAATLELAGANTFTGKFVTGGGALILSNSLALQSAALDTATGAGLVNLSGITTLTLGGLTGATGDLASVITTGYSGLTALTLNNGATQSYSGVIANGASGMTLTKTGAGVQTLAGASANTYSGLTTVSAGGLTLAKTAGDAIAGNILVNGGALSVTVAGTQIADTATVEVSSGSFTIGNGLNETVATVKLTGGNIIGGNATSTLTATTPFDLQSGSSTAVLAGTAGATKTTGGTVSLSRGSTYSGGTTLTDGTLQIGVGNVGSVGAITSSAIGTGSLALNGGQISSNNAANNRTLLNAITIGGNVTLGDATNTGIVIFSADADLTGGTRTLTTSTGSGATFNGIVSNGGITKDGAGILILNGGNTYTGPTTISAGTLQIGNGGTSGSIATTSGVTNNAALVYNRSNDLTASYAIGGTGTLTKLGAGTLTLTGNNGYTGATTVSAGTLELSGTGSINSSTNIIVNGGTFKNNSSVNLAAPLTFTSGTVGGTNLAGVAITVGTGNILSPGNSPGTMTADATTFANGGTYLFEINNAGGTAGANWDLLNATTLDVTATGGGFTVSVASLVNPTNVAGNADGFVPDVSKAFLFVDAGSAITSFSATAFTVNTTLFTNTVTGTWAIARGDTVSGGDNTQLYVTYTVIPEPSGYAALAGVGMIGFALYRRRRQQKAAVAA